MAFELKSLCWIQNLTLFRQDFWTTSVLHPHFPGLFGDKSTSKKQQQKTHKTSEPKMWWLNFNDYNQQYEDPTLQSWFIQKNTSFPPKKDFRCSSKSVDFLRRSYIHLRVFFPGHGGDVNPPFTIPTMPRWFPPSREDLRLRRRCAALCRTGPCSLRGGLLDV